LSGSPGRPLAQTGLGESLFVSPRRDWLAWTRLTGLAIVSPAAAMFFKPTQHTKHYHASSEGLIHTISNQPKNKPKQHKTGNPNFPYLETGVDRNFDGTAASTAALGMNWSAENNRETEPRGINTKP